MARTKITALAGFDNPKLLERYYRKKAEGKAIARVRARIKAEKSEEKVKLQKLAAAEEAKLSTRVSELETAAILRQLKGYPAYKAERESKKELRKIAKEGRQKLAQSQKSYAKAKEYSKVSPEAETLTEVRRKATVADIRLKEELRKRGILPTYVKTKKGIKEVRLRYKPTGRKEGMKAIKHREKVTRGTLSALGIIGGKQTYKGAGRPRGTYKYGMPIQVYNKMLQQKRALYQQYQQEQYARLKPRGYSPEQIQMLQQQQALQELEQPTTEAVIRQVQPQAIQETIGQPRQLPQFLKMKVPTGRTYVKPSTAPVDDELNFRKWSAETTISPRTQDILDNLRRIQNKGKADNIEMQRRLRERNMVGRAMNMTKAHENMIDSSLDFTGVPEDNILKAPNIFREVEGNNILRRRGINILNTREGGNDIKFF